jgi:hypothetical protein
VALAALGIDADEDQMRELLAAVKSRALSTKSLLPLEEVARLAAERVRPLAGATSSTDGNARSHG